MSRPLAERVTESFYAWEMRGRGWQLADYPVSLEPPYRPFFLLTAMKDIRTLLANGDTEFQHTMHLVRHITLSCAHITPETKVQEE